MSLIALVGKAGVGKDLTANIINYLCYKRDIEAGNKELCFMSLEEFQNVTYSRLFPNKYRTFKNVKFADKLKDCVCILLGCTRSQLEDREFKESYLSSEWDEIFVFIEGKKIVHERKQITYRQFMQLLGTEVGRNLHQNIWVNSTFSNYTEDSKWIISDVRFKNEAEAIKEKNGLLIRINRKGYENTGDHASETALDSYTEFDYVIENDSTIEDLIEKVKNILIKEKIL